MPEKEIIELLPAAASAVKAERSLDPSKGLGYDDLDLAEAIMRQTNCATNCGACFGDLLKIIRENLNSGSIDLSSNNP